MGMITNSQESSKYSYCFVTITGMKLILPYGPPGVGKMTIAKELAAITGYTLFHNHMLLNALSDIFGFDHPVRKKLEKEFRLRVIRHVLK